MAISGDAKRYRLSVPVMDTSVQKWLDAQINLSISIRHLIRDDIAKHGYTDITCRDVEQGSEPEASSISGTNSPKKQASKQVQNDANTAPKTATQTMNIPAPEQAPIPEQIMGGNIPQPMAQPAPQPVPMQAPPTGQNTDDILASMIG